MAAARLASLPKVQETTSDVPGVGKVRIVHQLREHFESPGTYMLSSWVFEHKEATAKEDKMDADSDEDEDEEDWDDEDEADYSNGGKQYAAADSLILLRAPLRGQWYSVADAGRHEELQQFAAFIFNNRFEVLDKIVKHPHQKGTGVWGPELSKGNVLYIKDFEATANKRRKGLGSLLLADLLAHPASKECAFAFILPGPSSRPRDQADAIRLFDIANLFARAKDFRRVGRTKTFGLPLKDPSHPVFSLPAANDVASKEDDLDAYGAAFDEADRLAGRPVYPEEDAHADPLAFLMTQSPRQDWQILRFPMHDKLANAAHNNPATSASQWLTHLRSLPPAALMVKDRSGHTVLHCAAGMGNFTVVQYIIQQCKGLEGFDINAISGEGTTPLDCIEEDIRMSRGFADAMGLGPEHRLASDDKAKTLHLLLSEGGFPVPPSADRNRPWLGCKDYDVSRRFASL